MNSNRARRKSDRRGERGSIMAMTAIGMLSLLMAVGLGVDISHLYLAKSELQNAADASALAGASGLNFHPSGITIAANRAVEEMNKYEFVKQDVVFPRTNVRFAVNLQDFASGMDMSEAAASSASVAPNIKFVKVMTTPSPVKVTFASMVLGSSKDISAEAIAGVSVPLNIYAGYLPVCVVDGASYPEITPGNLYTIRGEPSGFVEPGNYQVLAIDGAGGADDRTGLAGGVQNPVGAGGFVDTKPGVTAGAVTQGLNTRFDDYGSQLDPTQYPPDTNIKEGITYEEYLSGSPTQAPTHPGVAGRRVVLIPIVKETEFDGGRTNVQIDHFGAFFLRTKATGGNGGSIQAEYIGIGVLVGSGNYDPSAAPNSGPPITKPVLYR